MLFDSIPHKDAGACGRPDLSLNLVIHGGGVALVRHDSVASGPRSPAGEDFFQRRWNAKYHPDIRP